MENLLKELKKLNNDIEECIESLVNARIYHDDKAEGKAIFWMQSLMCGAQQTITCTIDRLDTPRYDGC